MKNKILIDTALLFLAAFIAFLLIPLYMIGNNPSDYAFLDANVFYKTAFLYVLVSGFLLSLISLPLQVLKLKRTSIFYTYFVLSWIIFAGFIFPVSSSTGMVDPENNPINYTNLYITLAGSLFFSFLSITVFKKYVNIFFTIILLTSVAPAVFNIYNSDTLKSIDKNHPSLEVSNKKNIFVISFDGMPGEIVTKIIKEDQNYSNALKDFIIFDNAVSQAPATAASLIGDIYGIQDYKSKGETLKEVQDTLKEEGMFDKIISEHIKDSFQYGYGYNMEKIKMVDPISHIQEEFDTFDFFKYPIVRLWTSELLKMIKWKNYILPTRQYIVKTNTTPIILKKLEKHNGENWDKKHILTINRFKSFISDLTTSNEKELSLRYIHLTFTHFPVDYDAECSYRSDDKEWYTAHQNEQGIYNQDICAIGKFTEFINKLKELEIYDNSLIVFKSDHGKPTTYFSTPPNDYTINGNKKWGYSRYRPMLMIKGFNAKYNNPIHKSQLVLLNDIAKTLCEESHIDTDCNSFHGVNLMGSSLDSNQAYYLYVAKDINSSFSYKDHISVKVPSRNISLIKAMKESSFINLAESQEIIRKRIYMTNLNKVKKALDDYYQDHQQYPKSSKGNGWDGICSKWGKSTPDYIQDLAPKYIEKLPVDPRKSKNCGTNYLYRSNGKDYKFILHGINTSGKTKNLLDPIRKDYAFGIWTDGAEKW